MSNVIHMPRATALQLDKDERATLIAILKSEADGQPFAFPYERDKRPPVWRLYDRCMICAIIRDDAAPALAFTLTTLGKEALANCM